MDWTAVLWISYQNNTVPTCTSLSQDIFNFRRRLKTFISQENKIASFIPLNKKAILYVFDIIGVFPAIFSTAHYTVGTKGFIFSCRKTLEPTSPDSQPSNAAPLSFLYWLILQQFPISLSLFYCFHQLQIVLGLPTVLMKCKLVLCLNDINQHYVSFHLCTHGGDNMSFTPLFSYCGRYSSFRVCSHGTKITTLLLETMNFSNIIIMKNTGCCITFLSMDFVKKN